MRLLEGLQPLDSYRRSAIHGRFAKDFLLPVEVAASDDRCVTDPLFLHAWPLWREVLSAATAVLHRYPLEAGPIAFLATSPLTSLSKEVSIPLTAVLQSRFERDTGLPDRCRKLLEDIEEVESLCAAVDRTSDEVQKLEGVRRALPRLRTLLDALERTDSLPYGVWIP